MHAAGDIGCYTLGAVAPLSVVDTTICMGASISSLHGMEKAKAKDCQIVMYGHTHTPVVEEENGILVINPGSLTYPRQRGRRPSYAVMEIEEGNILR